MWNSNTALLLHFQSSWRLILIQPTISQGTCALKAPRMLHINVNQYLCPHINRKWSCHVRTCRRLFELLAFLLPPFPGFEKAPQGGKFAPMPNRWGMGARHQGLGAHGGQPLYFLSWKRTNATKETGPFSWKCIKAVLLIMQWSSSTHKDPSSKNLCLHLDSLIVHMRWREDKQSYIWHITLQTISKKKS